MYKERFWIPMKSIDLLSEWKECATGKRMLSVSRALGWTSGNAIPGQSRLILDGITDEQGFRGFIYEEYKNPFRRNYRPYGPVSMESVEDHSMREEGRCCVEVAYLIVDPLEIFSAALAVAFGLAVLLTAFAFTSQHNSGDWYSILAAVTQLVCAFIVLYTGVLFFRYHKGRKEIPMLLDRYYGAEPAEMGNRFELE